MQIRFPRQFQEVLGPLAAEARRERLPLYAVGGCVRDWVLGAPTQDLDFVTESDPLPLIRFCSRRWGGTAERFDSFGTVRCSISSGLRLDFVRARAERYPQPAALPVVRAAGLSEDLARRDFSVNAMAVAVRSADSGELIDPQRGWTDLKRRLLRVLHPLSFRDDPTRMFRAARYACRYRLRLEAGTESLRRDAMRAGYALRLSRERARNELVRILEEQDPVCALRTIKAWKLSGLLHDRLAWPKNIAEGGGPWERLGMIALHLQDSSQAGEPLEAGLEFVRSLRLERPISRPIEEALRICARRAAPRDRPDPLACRIIALMRARLSAAPGGGYQAQSNAPGTGGEEVHPSRRYAPGTAGKEVHPLPAAALQPVLISGRDLQDLDLKPGPRYQRILDRAARAQWRGEFADRPQALRWLRANLE